MEEIENDFIKFFFLYIYIVNLRLTNIYVLDRNLSCYIGNDRADSKGVYI